MKHCLTGALWIFIALGLPLKLSAALMFILILIPFFGLLNQLQYKLDKEWAVTRTSVMKAIADFGKPENWQP